VHDPISAHQISFGRPSNVKVIISLDKARTHSETNEPFSHDSLSDLLLFMSQISFGRRPAIYLLDNGNFRAVWRNIENEQAALQFRGDDIVHCVFFLKRKAPRLPLNQETLIDVIPNVRARLIAFERLLKG
jgi:hypothetical protein